MSEAIQSIEARIREVFPEIPDGAVFNEVGQVGLKFYKLYPLRITCNENTYIFMIRADIPFTWAEPGDYACMVGARTRACCGGRKKPGGILLASEDDVRRWTNGGGR